MMSESQVTTPKLKIGGLNKSFGEGARRNEVLHDISLDLADNEFVSLVGTSGCGKSTLLSIVAGLQDYDAGDLRIDGASIVSPGLDRGVVFQSYTLLPWLTAQQNIEFALKAAGHDRASCRDIAKTHLELVQLPHAADRYPNELSGGMKQRVAIARGMAMEPDIMLMDEPFAALDALTRRKMQEELLQLWDDTHFTVLFVTHSIAEAITIGNRILLLSPHPGQVKAELNSLPRQGSTIDEAKALELRIHTMLFADSVESAEPAHA
jgi:NitT/TauT family transport system ATP-binding protein